MSSSMNIRTVTNVSSRLLMVCACGHLPHPSLYPSLSWFLRQRGSVYYSLFGLCIGAAVLTAGQQIGKGTNRTREKERRACECVIMSGPSPSSSSSAGSVRGAGNEPALLGHASGSTAAAPPAVLSSVPPRNPPAQPAGRGGPPVFSSAPPQQQQQVSQGFKIGAPVASAVGVVQSSASALAATQPLANAGQKRPRSEDRDAQPDPALLLSSKDPGAVLAGGTHTQQPARPPMEASGGPPPPASNTTAPPQPPEEEPQQTNEVAAAASTPEEEDDSAEGGGVDDYTAVLLQVCEMRVQKYVADLKCDLAQRLSRLEVHTLKRFTEETSQLLDSIHATTAHCHDAGPSRPAPTPPSPAGGAERSESSSSPADGPLHVAAVQYLYAVEAQGHTPTAAAAAAVDSGGSGGVGVPRRNSSHGAGYAAQVSSLRRIREQVVAALKSDTDEEQASAAAVGESTSSSQRVHWINEKEVVEEEEVLRSAGETDSVPPMVPNDILKALQHQLRRSAAAAAAADASDGGLSDLEETLSTVIDAVASAQHLYRVLCATRRALERHHRMVVEEFEAPQESDAGASFLEKTAVATSRAIRRHVDHRSDYDAAETLQRVEKSHQLLEPLLQELHMGLATYHLATSTTSPASRLAAPMTLQQKEKHAKDGESDDDFLVQIQQRNEQRTHGDWQRHAGRVTALQQDLQLWSQLRLQLQRQVYILQDMLATQQRHNTLLGVPLEGGLPPSKGGKRIAVEDADGAVRVINEKGSNGSGTAQPSVLSGGPSSPPPTDAAVSANPASFIDHTLALLQLPAHQQEAQQQQQGPSYPFPVPPHMFLSRSAATHLLLHDYRRALYQYVCRLFPSAAAAVEEGKGGECRAVPPGALHDHVSLNSILRWEYVGATGSGHAPSPPSGAASTACTCSACGALLLKRLSLHEAITSRQMSLLTLLEQNAYVWAWVVSLPEWVEAVRRPDPPDTADIAIPPDVSEQVQTSQQQQTPPPSGEQPHGTGATPPAPSSRSALHELVTSLQQRCVGDAARQEPRATSPAAAQAATAPSLPPAGTGGLMEIQDRLLARYHELLLRMESTFNAAFLEPAFAAGEGVAAARQEAVTYLRVLLLRDQRHALELLQQVGAGLLQRKDNSPRRCDESRKRRSDGARTSAASDAATSSPAGPSPLPTSSGTRATVVPPPPPPAATASGRGGREGHDGVRPPPPATTAAAPFWRQDLQAMCRLTRQLLTATPPHRPAAAPPPPANGAEAEVALHGALWELLPMLPPNLRARSQFYHRMMTNAIAERVAPVAARVHRTTTEEAVLASRMRLVASHPPVPQQGGEEEEEGGGEVEEIQTAEDLLQAVRAQHAELQERLKQLQADQSARLQRAARKAELLALVEKGRQELAEKEQLCQAQEALRDLQQQQQNEEARLRMEVEQTQAQQFVELGQQSHSDLQALLALQHQQQDEEEDKQEDKQEEEQEESGLSSPLGLVEEMQQTGQDNALSTRVGAAETAGEQQNAACLRGDDGESERTYPLSSAKEELEEEEEESRLVQPHPPRQPLSPQQDLVLDPLVADGAPQEEAPVVAAAAPQPQEEENEQLVPPHEDTAGVLSPPPHEEEMGQQEEQNQNREDREEMNEEVEKGADDEEDPAGADARYDEDGLHQEQEGGASAVLSEAPPGEGERGVLGMAPAPAPAPAPEPKPPEEVEPSAAAASLPLVPQSSEGSSSWWED
eukprot:gene12752-8692_t